MKIIVGENAGAGKKSALAENVAAIDEILIGKHVVRAGLHVQPGGDAVSQAREEGPVLSVKNAAADFGPLPAGVAEAPDNRFATHLENPRTRPNPRFRTHA